MRKAILAMLLAVMSSSAAAVECGPIVQTSRLENLTELLTAAETLLNQHNRSFLNEWQNLRDRTLSDAILQQIQKIQFETDLLGSVIANNNSIKGPLDTTLTLANIRDAMVDKRDRTVVALYLSQSAAYTRKIAEISYRDTNESLTKISRPGVAGDVSKLRDAIGMVLRELEKCESPKMPARVPQTRPQL